MSLSGLEMVPLPENTHMKSNQGYPFTFSGYWGGGGGMQQGSKGICEGSDVLTTRNIKIL